MAHLPSRVSEMNLQAVFVPDHAVMRAFLEDLYPELQAYASPATSGILQKMLVQLSPWRRACSQTRLASGLMIVLTTSNWVPQPDWKWSDRPWETWPHS